MLLPALLLKGDCRKYKGCLINKPFSNLVNLSDTLNNHSKLTYNREARQVAEAVKVSVENPASRMDVMTSSALQSQMEENEHVLRHIVHAVLFLGKQGLAFHGDQEQLNSRGNTGNFLALLKTFLLNLINSFIIIYISPRQRMRHTSLMPLKIT